MKKIFLNQLNSKEVIPKHTAEEIWLKLGNVTNHLDFASIIHTLAYEIKVLKDKINELEKTKI